MKTFKPPIYPKISKLSDTRIFLAGSIEMGKAVDWQKELTTFLKDEDVIIFNPRRDDWDSSWEQSIENKEFKEQVIWEMDHLLKSDIVVFYIQADTKSPITLYELGLLSLPAKAGKIKVIVCCEDGFWRGGNVEVVCYKFGIPLVETLNELKAELKKIL